MTRRIRQIAKFQILAALIHIAVAVRILIAGFLQERLCPIQVVGSRPHGITAKRHALGERADRRRTVALQQHLAEVLLIERHRNRPTHAHILQLGRLVVERRLIDARRIGLADLVLCAVLLEKLQTRIGQTLRGIQLAALHRHRQRITVGNALDNDLVELRLDSAPILLVFRKLHFGIRDLLRHIRAGADDDAILFSRFHVDDAGIGICQCVDERRHLLARYEGDGLSIRRDGLELQILRCAVMLRHEIFQARLDRLARHLLTVGKHDIVAQLDLHRIFVHLLKALGKPRHRLHLLIEAEQGLADSVAQGAPAVVGNMRVRARILHRRAVRHRAVGKDFLPCRLVLVRTTARENCRRKKPCQSRRQSLLIHLHFL